MEQPAFTVTTPAARGCDPKQRFAVLTSLGVPWRDAVPAALDLHLDVAAVADLVYRGCTPQIALSIVA
jgi:hypothetical protein